MNSKENDRPWGFYEILSESDSHKVKRITVNSGKRLSLQSHKKRKEHWYVIQGQAKVEINEKKMSLSVGASVDINTGDLHRVENSGEVDLIFIEIQSGSYFGEDDIMRYEDDYGRV